MTEDELKALKKDVNQKKRIANEWASQIHDLVEDRLWTDFPNLPELAKQTHQACSEWAEALARLEAAGGKP
ncbi:Rop-like protein [Azomonas agilis]|uniref:Rop-like protein n=1 Tax=Azomonas agilis TaxID=116849 RepID=A0A562J3M7_9GAMM|nr:CCE_0567 family metalloprotein [Azomonas agilis]TWH77444.1 Rop-like protein [Azomonas agilis]